MRSCLILPDDPLPQAKCLLACGADALLLDLREAACVGWESAPAFLRLARTVEPRPQVYVRLGPLEGGAVDLALTRLRDAPPDGIFLEKAAEAASVQHLGSKLAVFEAEAGLPDGATRIVALSAQTPEAVFALGGYRNCSPRLAALAFETEPLARALKIEMSDEAPPAPIMLARSLLALAASAASVLALDLPSRRRLDDAELRAQCLEARRNGFSGRGANAPEEIAIIQEAFRTRA
ncbi:MAG: aldolase/citrate lyase family protein [Methylocystis sp.]